MPSQPIPEFLAHVAHNVRSRRSAAGLSQRALADAAGVSLRMIGAIEGGTSSVSTSTLDRIGIVLGASLADLVANPESPATQQPRRLGWKGRHGGTGTLLSSVRAVREVETWEWRLKPGESYRAGADPRGWHVQLVVVAGQVTLLLDGEERVLPIGAHLFASDRAHAFFNRGKRPARFFRMTIC
ncbi:helix-turn-helix domain-containing protein [Pseudoxanthomonas wuyuanensis]